MTTFTNLGVIQTTAALLTPGIYGQKVGGDLFTTWLWMAVPQEDHPQSLACLNMDTGEVISPIEGPVGRTAHSIIHIDDRLLYLGCYANSSTDSSLFTVDYETGTVNICCAIPTYGGIHNGVQCMTYSDEAHKRIFVGTTTSGGLMAYDPITQTTEDYGVLDSPGGSLNRYVTSIQVTGTLAYCGMKDDNQSSLSYLIIADITGNPPSITTYWKITLKICYVYRGTDDTTIYIFTKDGSDVERWYQADGTDTPILLGGEPAHYGLEIRNNLIDNSGYSTNGDLAFTDGSGVNKTVTLRYRKPGVSAPTWLTAEAEMYEVSDFSTRGGGVDLDGNFIIYGEQYAPAIKINPATDQKALLGQTPGDMSGYSLYSDSSRSRIFMGGYPNNAYYEYDPSQPWLSYTNPALLTVANPNPSYARYLFMIDKDANDLIWMWFSDTRSLYRSALVWYDPDTQDTDVSEYTTLRDYYLTGGGINGVGNKVIINGEGDSDGFMFVLSASTKAIINTYTPINGATDHGRIVRISGDTFIGIINGLNYKSYCIDIGTGSLLWGPRTYTGKTSAFGFGPDFPCYPPIYAGGHVWYYEDNYIVKMNPTNGDVTQVQAVTTPGILYLVGNSFYHVDYTNKLLYKLTGAILSYSKGDYSSLPSYDNDLEFPYTDNDIADVATDDTDMVAQLATSQIAIHQFKQQITGTGGIINVVAQVTIPCSTSTAYLQIYNRSGTPAWETIDSDNATGANTDFTLSATVADLTDYKDENNIVACRVYQEMQ